jgi:hypothetical protein
LAEVFLQLKIELVSFFKSVTNDKNGTAKHELLPQDIMMFFKIFTSVLIGKYFSGVLSQVREVIEIMQSKNTE